MNLTRKAVLRCLASTVLAAGLCACGKEGGTPGEKLDRALDKTGEKVKEAGEAIQSK